MAKAAKTSYSDMSIADLQKKLLEERKNNHFLRMAVASQKNKNTHELHQSKETIARILTEINSRKSSK